MQLGGCSDSWVASTSSAWRLNITVSLINSYFANVSRMSGCFLKKRSVHCKPPNQTGISRTPFCHSFCCIDSFFTCKLSWSICCHDAERNHRCVVTWGRWTAFLVSFPGCWETLRPPDQLYGNSHCKGQSKHPGSFINIITRVSRDAAGLCSSPHLTSPQSGRFAWLVLLLFTFQALWHSVQSRGLCSVRLRLNWSQRLSLNLSC